MRITENGLRRLIRSVIAENVQDEMSKPPELMDFYTDENSEYYPRYKAAMNAAPKDFVNYGGQGKFYESEQDFVEKMTKQILGDIEEASSSYEMQNLNKAYELLFNGSDGNSLVEGCSQTEYEYSAYIRSFPFGWLLQSLGVNEPSPPFKVTGNVDKNLMSALRSLYDMNGNWSHYWNQREVAFS